MDIVDKAQEILGPTGRMLSGSKSAYHHLYPTRKPVFNANVLTKSDGKIWYGDLDLSLKKDREALFELSYCLYERVFVFREMDARFGTENTPDWDKAVEVFLQTR